MVNRNIDLPSQRAKIPFEVERPLRRKFKKEHDISAWLVAVLWLLVLTALTLFVGRIVDDQAHAEAISRNITCSSLEARYKADMSLLKGTEAEQTIKRLCD